MAVSEQTPYIEHTGNGATTSFALKFQCESKDHLIVLVDEIEPPIETWSLTGGNVVFTTAPAAGKKITLQRNTPFSRTTDYQSYNNSFRPPAVNEDFDRIWLKLQELGLASWLLRLYVDRLHQKQEEKIDNLKIYVDDKDDELRSYLLEEIRKQGVALDQLDEYYNYLMQRLAQIAVDKGWEASFVVDASGLNQQQINNLSLTPFQFGAIGDGQSHKLSERYSTLVEAQSVYPIATSLNDEIDWCALQTMCNYALSQGKIRKSSIDWSGYFCLNKGIKYIADTDETGAWRSINGDLQFRLRADFDQSYEAVISLSGRGINQQGVIQGSCRNLVKYGVITVPRDQPTRIDFGIKLDRIYIDNAKIYGVAMFQGSMFGTLNLYRGGGCGVSGIYAGKKLESNFSGKTDTYVNPVSSYSTLNVDVLPPYPTNETPTFVKIGDYLSEVSEIDTNAKTLKIEPHIPSNATGILDYIYGGGVFIEGSNTASVTVGGISAVGCGIGLYHANMYPTTVNNFASEYSGIAIVEAGLVAGANILTHYFEGDGHQYVNINSSADTFGSTTFQHGTAFEFNKVAYLPYRANPDGTHYAPSAGARGLSVRTSKYLHKLESGKNPNNYFSSCVIDFNTPHTLLSYKGDVATVTFADISPDSNRLFGYDTQDIQFFGTAQNAAPQQITFSVLAGYKLNGGTSNLTFNTFSAAAKFSCFLDVKNKNIIVSAITESGKSYSVSGLYPYSSLDSTADVGYWYISDYTQISSMPTPTAVTKRCAFKQYYVYGDRANGAFTITKEVFFMDINETWERTYNQATGVQSAWLLKSYQTRKGATAQRPNNPQLGMRYYDTTLLAAGKPIEWNGAAWVDAAGATV